MERVVAGGDAGRRGGIRRVLYQHFINVGWWRYAVAISVGGWVCEGGSGGRATRDRSPIEITVYLEGFTFTRKDFRWNDSVKSNIYCLRLRFLIHFQQHCLFMYLLAYVVPPEMIKRKT